MARIGGDGQHLLFFAVQRKGIEAQFLVPERLIESFEQCRGLCAQLAGAAGFAEHIEYLGHAQPGVVDVTLQFAQRFRSLHQRAVRIDDAVAGILPSHVLVADRRTGLIFLKSVAIAIAIMVDPGQASLGSLEMPLQQRLVPGCPPGGVQVIR